MKKKVVLLKILDYKVELIKEKIEKTIDKYFNFKELFPLSSKILLKPNLLMEALPSEAITTHPIFIEAIARIFKERNFSVSIADTCGGFINNKVMEEVYHGCGLREISKNLNIELLFPTKSILKESLPLCWWSEGFKIVNLPKLKTHNLLVLTLATKNLFGCVSGLYKSYLHRVYPKSKDFVNVLIKLYKLIVPSLNIVDGIVALEGEGPAKEGSPKKLGLVVIGDDALYTDYVIGKFLGLNEEQLPLIKKAKELGLVSDNNIEIISEFKYGEIKNFKIPPLSILERIPQPILSFLKFFLKFKPHIDEKKCIECFKCESVCPQKAIKKIKDRPFIDYKICIMCMCCNEVCTKGAIKLNKSFLLRILDILHRWK